MGISDLRLRKQKTAEDFVGLAAKVVTAFFLLGTHAQAQQPAEYTWMLPRTVLDVTVTYNLVNCTETGSGAAKRVTLEVKALPVITPRPIPDLKAELKKVTVDQLESWWQDRTIDLKTYAGSHILASIGSAPADQTMTVVSNVLTGVAQIAGAVLGVSRDATPPPRPACGPALAAKNYLENILTPKIIEIQKQLVADNIPDDQLKKLMTQLSNLQALQSTFSNSMASKNTLVITRTVDPGFTPVLMNSPDIVAAENEEKINANGLIASIIPSDEEVAKTDWVTNAVGNSIFPVELSVNVYLDFKHAYPELSPNLNTYNRVTVDDTEIFREAEYIPVHAYFGKPINNWAVSEVNSDLVAKNAAAKAKKLIAPLRIPFCQFGPARKMSFTAELAQSNNWSLTFLENGEMTAGTFGSKARAATLTGGINNSLTAMNSLLAEQRTAAANNSPTAKLVSENTELQARINNITLKKNLQGLLGQDSTPVPPSN